MPAWRPDRGPPAGERPRSGRGGSEGAGPGRGRTRRAWAERRAGSRPAEQSPRPEPNPRRRAPLRLGPPSRVAQGRRLRCGSLRRGPRSDVSLRGPRPRGGVSGSGYRRGRRRGGERRRTPGSAPSSASGRATPGRSPHLPRRGWCVPGDVRAARPAWRVRPSDVGSRGRSCPSAPKAAGGLRAWGRGSGAARAPARAPSPCPGPARAPGRRGTGAPAGAGGGAAATTTRRDRSLRPSGPLPRTTGCPRASGSGGPWRPATPDPSASAQPLSLKSSGRLQPR